MIKRLKMEQLLATDEAKAAFVSEARLLLSIHSPRILLFMGFTETEPLCLVWEWLEGGSLYDAIHVKNMQLKSEKQIAMDICSGLLFLHTAKPALVHGDLHSSNVFLCGDDGRAKIGGIGLNCLKKHNELNKTSDDVYSFGKILYELCTKQQALFAGGGTSVAEMGSNVSGDWRLLIRQACAEKASDRPSMEAMYSIIDRLGATSTTTIIIDQAPTMSSIISFQQPDSMMIDSMFRRALAVYGGAIGIRCNVSQAFKMFERLVVQHKHAHSMAMLGRCYHSGDGVAKRDFKKALDWFQRSAKAESAFGYYELASFLQSNGNVIEADKWFSKAAAQMEVLAGYPHGMCMMGYMYECGLGIRKDAVEGVIWHRKSAVQGHADAQNSLGVMYAEGRGIGKDEVEAAKWYRKSAEQGHAAALYNLGIMYEKGQSKDYVEAAKWYRKSADQGNADAQFNLSMMYEDGQGIGKNEVEAAKWFRKAADQGDADAQFNLGIMYENGEGIRKDIVEAVKWFRKAADQGDANAQSKIGIMCANGQGMRKDLVEAVKWYRKAAAQGDADAIFFLGLAYANGHGVDKDGDEALKWCVKAAELGHADAVKVLSSVQ